jgi:hypothetical protein
MFRHQNAGQHHNIILILILTTSNNMIYFLCKCGEAEIREGIRSILNSENLETGGECLKPTTSCVVRNCSVCTLHHLILAIRSFVGPLPLFQILDPICSRFGRGISPSQGHPTHNNTDTEQTHTDTHASIGIRTHDPSARASEDSSCLRPRSRNIVEKRQVGRPRSRWDYNFLLGREGIR